MLRLIAQLRPTGGIGTTDWAGTAPTIDTVTATAVHSRDKCLRGGCDDLGFGHGHCGVRD